jgi:hypothetical protein
MPNLLLFNLSGMVLVFSSLALLISRLLAKSNTRSSAGLSFVVLAYVGGIILNGFEISHASKGFLGQLNTVFSFLMLGFALLETLLLDHIERWRRSDWFILIGVTGLGVLNLGWKFFILGGFISSDLLYPSSIILLILLRPGRKDLENLSKIGIAGISLIFLIACLHYQEPYNPYTQTDYGVDGPYHNWTWDAFGYTERFRGPYQHPNMLGIQVVFLCNLSLMKKNRINFLIVPASFLILNLASSRSSLIALMAGISVRYFLTKTATSARKRETSVFDRLELVKRKKSDLRILSRLVATGSLLPVLALLAYLILQNSTLSGRTSSWGQAISASKKNLFLGTGPGLLDINGVENTVVTLLSYYGLAGIFCLFICLVGIFTNYNQIMPEHKSLVAGLIATFTLASLTEALLVGNFYDAGPFYFILILIASRVKSSLSKT